MTTEMIEQGPMTALEVRSQVNLIQEVMKAVMKKDEHYGIIPGCQKPSLYKPGAEKLLVTFRISAEPIVEDLSTTDEARYRVIEKGTSILTGAYLGSGIGECSSHEEKFKWRKAVCEEEWNETAEDRRREKWARGQNGGYKIKQIRTNHADVANTILKMASKRAYVALALKTTAASDIFEQDIEDLPAEIIQEERPPIAEPQRKEQNIGSFITEVEAKLLATEMKKTGITEDSMKNYLKQLYNCESMRLIKKTDYDKILAWVHSDSKE